MIRCPACGHDNADTNNFCANCGQPLSGVEHTGDTTRVVAVTDSADDTMGESDLSADDVSAINQLPPESALLIVRQGPSAGARFLVDSDVTTAGRHPRCDIFLDDMTLAEFEVAVGREVCVVERTPSAAAKAILN